jgi:hypothetical protein
LPLVPDLDRDKLATIAVQSVSKFVALCREYMTEYRAYVIGSDDHIVSATALVCANDEAAIAEVRTFLLADHRTLERRPVRYTAVS